MNKQELDYFNTRIRNAKKSAVADMCATMDRNPSGQARIAFTGVKANCMIGTNVNDLMADAFNNTYILKLF